MNFPDGARHIHLVGIGGIGVSALAPALLQRGYAVTGSDLASNPVTDRLKKLGIPIFHEHRAENVKGASLLVVSSAVKETNPEIQAAHERGIPVWPRAKMLGDFLEGGRPIVVTGVHGKTTVTAIIAQVLVDAGLDPTAFIGGDVDWIGGNSLAGHGEWIVAEGDESDGSFIHLKPEIAVVNNIDADHLDFYRDIDEIIQQFKHFLKGVREDGWILASADCSHCQTLLSGRRTNVLTYGFSRDADIRGAHYRSTSEGTVCNVTVRGESLGAMRLRVRGECNAHNALAAVAVGFVLNLSFEQTANSLGGFQGVQRRMEIKGTERGITVIDDYAHHPAEIRATIEALRERKDPRLIAVFQPHLYSRTVNLLEDFGSAFQGLDLLVVTGIYAAREDPREGVTGELLLEPVRRNGVDAYYVEALEAVPEFLLPRIQEGDAVVTLGAGDVWKAGEALRIRLSGGEEALSE